MDKKLFLCVLFCFIILIPFRSKATHAVGADISYECLGGGKYKVTFKFYRDCAGNAGATPTESQNSITVNFTPKSCITQMCQVITPRTQKTFLGLGAPGCTITTNPGIDTIYMQKLQDVIVSMCPGGGGTAVGTHKTGGYWLCPTGLPVNDTAAACFKIDTIGWDTSYVACGSVPQPFTLTLTKAFGSGQEVTPLCPSAKSTCQGGSYNGIREFVFEGIVDMSTRGVCSDWVISFGITARNNAITTLTQTSVDLYVEAHLNNIDSVAGCNSAPTFTNKPVPFVCIGQQFCFNHGATDPDGDSLVYTLIPPKTSSTGTVTYKSGYSYTQPLKSSPPATVDPVTGDICLSPTQQEVTVMAVLVEEYRNGKKIGSVIRDMQINTITCSNNNPYLTGINGSAIFDTSVCAGQQFCFTVPSFDADASQNITVTWNQGIPGATFSTSSGNRPVGTFCWTPGASDVSTAPHCFTIKVEDDNCPLKGSQIFSYCISVGDPAVDLGPDTSVCSGSVTLDPGPGTGYTYLWSTGVTSKTITVSSSGKYYVTVSGGNSCVVADTINVVIGSLLVDLGPDAQVCSGDSVTFDAGYGGMGYTYNWSTGVATQTIKVGSSGIYSVTVSNGGCSGSDNVTVAVGTKPNAVVTGTATICPGQNTPLSVTGGASYSWDPTNTLDDPYSATPIASPLFPTTYSVVAYSGANLTGCTDTAYVTISMDSVFAHAIEENTVLTICPGDSLVLGDIPTAPSGTTILWAPSSGLSCTSCPNPVAKPSSTSTYHLTVTKGLCSAQDSVTVTVETVAASAGNDQVICMGDSVQLNASGGIYYSWSPATGLSCTTCQSPKASPALTTTYTVTVITATGCEGADMVKVSVDTAKLKPVSAGPDITICSNALDPVTIVANHANTGVTYAWNTGANTQSIQTKTPGLYIITLTGSCDAVSDSVTILPKPCSLLVPNVFSPVGDGINDYFIIAGLENYPGSRIQIFNRWGQKVYESEDYQNNWDGRHWKSLNRLSEGVYYYILEPRGEEARTGFITLIRGYKF